MSYLKTFTNGILKENPIFVLLLGMCPTLGTTTSAENGLGMGLATTFVLICSNVVISLIKNLVPDKVRILSESKAHHTKLGNEMHALLLEHRSEDKEPNAMEKGIAKIDRKSVV